MAADPAVPVPERLTRPHPFVATTRRAAKGLKVGPDGRLNIGGEEGVIRLVVSRALLSRALRIAQAVIAEAQRRGYEIKAIGKSYNHAAGAAIALQGRSYAFWLSELTDRVPLDATELKRWRQDNEYRFRYRLDDEEPEPPKTKPRANGRLQLSLEHRYGSGRQSNWGEGPRVGPLEDRLPAFFAALENRAEEDRQRMEECARRSQERERQAEARREHERLAKIQEARGQRLAAEAAAWRQAAGMRDYLAALRARLDDLHPEERERIVGWCQWAEEWVERSDPVINTQRIRGFDDDEDGRAQTPGGAMS